MIELRQISKIYSSKGGQVPALVDIDLALPIFTKIKKTPVDLLK